MSAEAVRAVTGLTIPTTYRERLLLTVLAQEADSRGIVASARVNQRWLAEQCGWSREERVREVAKRLCQRGLLDVLAEGRRATPTVYRLAFMGGATS